MKIKVSDLEGEQLAEWAARAQGWKLLKSDCEQHGMWVRGESVMDWEEDYRPDINGAQAMDLVVTFGIELTWNGCQDCWMAQVWDFPDSQWDEGIKIAITRAAIESVFGETVTVEDE